MFDAKTHWEKVYQQKPATEVSWYQANPELSLALIGAVGAGRDARVVDVGGGASRLVDHLVEAGYRHVTVLDIAGSALQQARRRLGDRAGQVTWLEQDVSAGLSRHRFDIWHDRAVFHFLTDPVDRSRYLTALGTALKPQGQLIIATFALDGPTRCSGLEVVRYSPETLGRTLGAGYHLEETRVEAHQTPAGKPQHFVYCRFSRAVRQG